MISQQNEKISVVIPVFNVEKYLDKCISSVANQTYSNLEILLIDDGSTDSSGVLCDGWAEKDPRIQVIHKENGGLADARNKGIELSSGDFLFFVDSDDFIAADMLLKMYIILVKNGADMSICNRYAVDENGCPVHKKNRYLPIRDEVLTGHEAIVRMLTVRNGSHYNTATCKLFKKFLFDDIRFPFGKICEDAYISHRLLGKCARIACISDACYYYTQRSNSIMHKNKPLIYLREVEFFFDRMFYCYGCNMFDCCGLSYWNAAMHLIKCYQHPDYNTLPQKEVEEAFCCLKKSLRFIKYCSFKKALQIIVVCINPNLYCKLFRTTTWKKIRQSFHYLFTMTICKGETS